MFYIKQDKQNQNAISLIEDVISSHMHLKKEKEIKVLELYKSATPNECLFAEIQYQEECIKNIDIQISGIIYTRDYVKLMTNLSNY